MTHEEIAEVQRRECTLCLARYLEADPEVADPFGMFCTAWFAGLDAGRLPPRDLAEVDRELAMVRERVKRAKDEFGDGSMDSDIRRGRAIGLIK